MRLTTLAHEFVEYIPAELADGVLYISITYRTAVHLCVCGCGNKVVRPISPADWQLLYDGDTVSLTPSIGNWGFPCRSHYWIKADQVRWSRAWDDDRIAAGWHATTATGPTSSAGAPPARNRRLSRPKPAHARPGDACSPAPRLSCPAGETARTAAILKRMTSTGRSPWQMRSACGTWWAAHPARRRTRGCQDRPALPRSPHPS